MKKTETYPPIQIIKEFTLKIPSIWESIAQAAQRMDESLWRPDIYITALRLEKEVLNQIYQAPNQTALMAAVLSTLASWRRCKEVYRFAPEMELLLYRQADCRLPTNVLFHLPYSSFYIETPHLLGNQYHGFFVSLDQAIDQTGERIKLFRCFACGSTDADIGLIELPLEEGKNLSDQILPATVRAANLAQVSVEEAKSFFMRYALRTTVIITKLCQLILYITAQNADIRKQVRPGKKCPKFEPLIRSNPMEIKDKYREIREWDVGYRIVDKMADVKKEQAEQDQMAHRGREDRKQNHMEKSGMGHSRMSPVPHLRCGHWQTFWIGKRVSDNPNRKQVLKWIAPTFVNCSCDSAERLPVTINRYKTKRQSKKGNLRKKEMNL